MYRKETSRKGLGDAFWADTRMDGANAGAGWTATEISAVECATEQIEHSWSEEFEPALWMWLVCATAANRISRTQRSERAPERVELRALTRSNNESNDPTKSYPYCTSHV